MKPISFNQIIDRVRYSTETATLLAGNDWWDGHNHERSGTNRFLYRTPRGRYFFLDLTQWQGSQNRLVPCSEGEAVEFYESVSEGCQRESYTDAFPGVTVEDA
jgi:hypothetical protein